MRKISIEIIFFLFSPFWKVCQVAAAPARPALHRPQMSGAFVLFQAHRRHAHRHLPDGDAGGTASDHMTPALPPYPCIYSCAVSKMKKNTDLIQIVKHHILYLVKCNYIEFLKKYFEVGGL